MSIVKPSGGPAPLKHYDPDEVMAAAPQAISAALERKAKKHCRPRPHFLLYVNLLGRVIETDFKIGKSKGRGSTIRTSQCRA